MLVVKGVSLLTFILRTRTDALPRSSVPLVGLAKEVGIVGPCTWLFLSRNTRYGGGVVALRKVEGEGHVFFTEHIKCFRYARGS
jgi:hypothetical protein